MPGSQRTMHKARILLEIITKHRVVPGSSTDSPGFDVSGIVCKCSAWAVRDGMLPAGCTGGGLLSLASHQRSATAWDFKCLWVSVGGTLRWATLSRALEAGKFYLQPLGGKPGGGSYWMERTWGKGKEQHRGGCRSFVERETGLLSSGNSETIALWCPYMHTPVVPGSIDPFLGLYFIVLTMAAFI